MRSTLALIVFAISCGPIAPPVNPSDSTQPEPQMEEEGLPPIESAEPVPTSCAFNFSSTFATETVSSERLPATGGLTDHASVVTVYTTVTIPGEVTIRYDISAKSCASATFKHSVVMTDVGADSNGQSYTGLIPALPVNTHVCWKILAPACGVTTSTPTPGMGAFDYTTK